MLSLSAANANMLRLLLGGTCSVLALLNVANCTGVLGDGFAAAGVTTYGDPLTRALLSQYIKPSVVRAMAARYAEKKLEYFPGIYRMHLSDIMRNIDTMASRMADKMWLETEKKKTDEKIYLFATNLASHFEYFDKNGEIKGVFVDIVKSVCEEAGKMCDVVIDSRDNCFSHYQEHPQAMEGILCRQYDGCIGWFKTKQGLHSAAFTDPFFIIDTSSRFYVKTGNPAKFRQDDIAGKKIGFVNTYVTDEYCLKENSSDISNSIRPRDVIYKDSTTEILDFLANGELDAAFLGDYGLDSRQGDTTLFEPIGEPIKCSPDGYLRIMTRKDSPLLPWFNIALQNIKDNGKYARACRKWVTEHGYIGSDTCFHD